MEQTQPIYYTRDEINAKLVLLRSLDRSSREYHAISLDIMMHTPGCVYTENDTCKVLDESPDDSKYY